MSRSPRRFASKVIAGARLFDRGLYFAAHEAWEEHWLVETDVMERRLLQGLIQIAAAFHKLLVMRSPAPAASLFEKGLTKLDACPREVDGWDFGPFRDAVRDYADSLRARAAARPRS